MPEVTSIEYWRDREAGGKKMPLFLTIIDILAGFAICVIGTQFLMPVVVNYQITPSCLWITMFGLLPVYRIPLRDASVQKLSFLECLTDPHSFGNLGIVNRFGWRGYVLIRRNSGIFRRVLVSPSDPDTFIEKLVASGAKRDPDALKTRKGDIHRPDRRARK